MPDTTRESADAPPASFDVEWCCWAADGWECAGEGSIRDASKTTRGQAAAFYAIESTGDITQIRVWKRYIRPYSLRDIWLGPGRDRWVDARERELIEEGVRPLPSLGELHDQAPADPPDGWQPDEYDSTWEFVSRDTPGAIPVWVCGFKGDEPPRVRAKAAAS